MQDNASIAVELPGNPGAVIVSVFTSGVSPSEVAPILCTNYTKLQVVVDLIILGDFECLAPTKTECNHAVFNGEAMADCIVEQYVSYAEYEKSIVDFSYGYNYVFRNGGWWRLVSENGAAKYFRLKKKKRKKK